MSKKISQLAAAAVGATTVALTLGNTAVSAQDYMNGTLVVDLVGNTGFEVDQAEVPGLFEPFRRGGRERTGARRHVRPASWW